MIYKQQVDELSNAWEHFKDNNEQKLKALESKNNDCIIDEQFTRLSTELDRCKDRINKEILHEKRPYFTQTTVSIERKNFINLYTIW